MRIERHEEPGRVLRPRCAVPRAARGSSTTSSSAFGRASRPTGTRSARADRCCTRCSTTTATSTAVATQTPPFGLVLSEVDDRRSSTRSRTGSAADGRELPTAMRAGRRSHARSPSGGRSWPAGSRRCRRRSGSTKRPRSCTPTVSRRDARLRGGRPPARDRLDGRVLRRSDARLARGAGRSGSSTVVRRAPARLVLWEDDGRLVSLAGHAGETPNGSRVGPVYTPPELRGRGYASALTAALTEQLLERRRFCFLYTDLANPTSNSIYQRIGYRPVTDVTVWRFAQPAPADTASAADRGDRRGGRSRGRSLTPARRQRGDSARARRDVDGDPAVRPRERGGETRRERRSRGGRRTRARAAPAPRARPARSRHP